MLHLTRPVTKLAALYKRVGTDNRTTIVAPEMIVIVVNYTKESLKIKNCSPFNFGCLRELPPKVPSYSSHSLRTVLDSVRTSKDNCTNDKSGVRAGWVGTCNMDCLFDQVLHLNVCNTR
jgi:hypothetical protein